MKRGEFKEKEKKQNHEWEENMKRIYVLCLDWAVEYIFICMKK